MRTLLLLFLAYAFAGPAQAQAQSRAYLDQLPPLIDRDVFFGDPEYSGAQISPDGRFISFLRPYNGVRNIWVKGVDEPFEAARPITDDTERPVSSYSWSRDGRYVLYVQDKGGDENYHVFAVDPSAGGPNSVPDARNLTPYDGARAMVLSVPRNTPDIIMVGLNDRDPQWHDVYRVDLNSGERELIAENTDEIAGWSFDLAGNLRMALRTVADGSTEVLRIDDDGSTHTVYTCSVFETCGPVRFHPDGQHVYFVTDKGEDVDLMRLVSLDIETGSTELVESDPENEVDFAGAEFSSVTDELLATYYVGDRIRMYPRNAEFGELLSTLRTRFGDADISFGSSTADESRYIIRVSSDVDPGSTYVLDRATGETTLLYRSRPDLPSEHLASMHPIRYTARDGVEIPAYLTLPQGVEAEKLPVVILPHGGPWARDMWGYDSFAQFLANRGYAVLQPNFRGSTGFGKHFLNLGNAEWGTGTMQHDITDGVRYLIDEGIADPDAVAIMGASYGGYATLAGLTFTPELYTAGVSIVGPSNLITLLNTIPPYWAAVRSVFNVRMGNLDEPADVERLRAQSPYFHADRIEAPLLVIQGANDPRVRQSESDQIVVAARENGVDVEYLVAPDEGHGFAGLENRLSMFAAIEQFLADHLGGRYQPDMPAEIATRLEELRVDVSSVTLPDIAAEDELTSDMPETDGGLVEPATLHYRTTMSAAGQSINLEVHRTVEAAELDGRAVWRITEHYDMPPQFGGVTSVDTFDLDRETLKPVRRFARSVMEMSFDYAGDAVTGAISGAGQNMPVNIVLDAPVMADGAGFELAVASMALEPGFQGVVRFIDPLQQRVRTMRLTVEEGEEMTTDAGTFATYQVALTPIDGDDTGAQSMLVRRDAPHYVVRVEQQLPPAAGGGTLTSVLVSLD